MDAEDGRPKSCRKSRRSTTRASRASSRARAARCSSPSRMALLIVYLVLAAQFESFIHPFVIMLTVPLALPARCWDLDRGQDAQPLQPDRHRDAVGLAAKNGILIVDFANKLRDEGRSVKEAILEAASVRLRPILMTSIATVAGAVPLVLRRTRLREP